jgi:polar amino acid transport system ATP-binding protein
MVGEVQAVIRMLTKRDMTMLIVTHEMNFAREVSTRILYLADGGIYEQGTPEEIFDNPQRDKTRAFIRKIKYFSYEITEPDFDLMQMQGGIQRFGEKYGLDQKKINRLQICCEELIYEMMTHCYPSGEGIHMELEVSYAETDQATEISLNCHGDEYNPFVQEDDGLGVTILKNMARQLDYQREGRRNIIRIKL